MSESETIGTGVMTSTEPFTVSLQKTPSVAPAIQNMRLAYSADGTAVYKPVAGSSPPYPSSGGSAVESSAAGTIVPHALNINVNMSEPMKKKRGRPRKYGPDGSMALALTQVASPAAIPQSTGPFSPPSFSGGSASPSSLKKARGRPPGSSKKKQMEALGSAGLGFTPHIITVKAGEDVSSKIMSFSQHGPRAVCILSANGVISNVTLRQAATSGGTATYEGRFDILSLCGSFLLTEVGGQRSRTGGLSVSLSGPDGRILGGSVAGLLTAASPVQVIVGSFIADGSKESKPVNQMETLFAPPKLGPCSGGGGGGGVTGTSSPPSRGTLSESSGGPGSPLNLSNNSHPQGMSSMPWR